MDSYTVKITSQAEKQIQEIIHYISHELKSPDAALHLLDSFENAFTSLTQFPQRVALMDEEPNSGGHTAYQNFVVENLRKYYPDPDAIARSTWDIIERFWNLDLSYTDGFLRSKYSVYGPKPRTPSCMQLFYLLSIDFKVPSVTDWAVQLKINPLYAILSGFEFGDTPGVGTFYDFFHRLWDSDSDNLSPHEHPVKKKKVKKAQKLNLSKKSLSTSYSNSWNRPLFPLRISLMLPFFRSITGNSWTSLSKTG